MELHLLKCYGWERRKALNFHEFGPRTAPHVMLIHGGGNAWWNYLRQARALSLRYHVILPTLDGHGEEYQIPYRSTEQTADRLMDYILRECGGRLFALGGVSLGGQIVMELLARKSDIAEKAIIDGSLCIPQPVLAQFCIASVRLFGPLLFSEKACRRQLALMDRVLRRKCAIRRRSRRTTFRICQSCPGRRCMPCIGPI